MKNPLWLPIAIFATVISSVQSFGELEAPDVKWGGNSSLRFGQVVRGQPEAGKQKAQYHRVWTQELVAGLSLESKFKNFPATGNLGVEFLVNNDNIIKPADMGVTRRLNFYPYLQRADLLFNIVDRDDASIELDIGYFPYKYNSSVRNLGEYLFRTGTYPQYIINIVDFPQARLTGLRFGGSVLGKKLNFDIIATVNTEWTAIGDLNLSGILAWKPVPLFELGFGGSWCSIVSANMDQTTPVVSSSEYLGVARGSSDTAIYNYTFAGQKIMARLEFDIKKLFPGAENFGDQDLKLYSEGAILGWVNYPKARYQPYGYENRWERIPIMFGFNFPTFKFLDVLNLEIEYFNNPYPNSTNSIRFENSPVPLSSYGGERDDKENLNQHEDDLKWSVYLKKTLCRNLSIMCQVANDHIRWHRLNYQEADGNQALRKKTDWYYTFKLGYAF
ncbi:MAG TPA: hypothetical protein VHO70_19265 [Chitinispirillaceae bacterium]|nr:hypothetical protein [Chitinispirillaceae bacterium]